MSTKTWYRRAAVPALLAAGLALAAPVPEAAAQRQNALQVVRAIDADRYDPHRTTALAAGEIVYLLSDTLVSLDFDQKTIKEGLAKSWSVSADGKTYTFNLRDDVKFCDGRAMTADDVVFSLKRWIDPEIRSPVRQRAGDVKEIRAKDPLTVEYELNSPYSELLFQLTQFFAVVIDKGTVERLGADFGVKGFGGVGPYCWVSWEPRNELVVERNPHYRWGPPIYQNRGPAQVERMVWRVVPEDSTRTAAIMSGQAHLTQYVPRVDMDTLRRARNVQVVKGEAYQWLYFIGFKVDKEVMADVRVRRALNLAVDQEAIAQSVFNGTARPAVTYTDVSTPDFYQGVLTLAPKFDRDQANKLLDEAGWVRGTDGVRAKDGKRLSFLLYGINNAINDGMMQAVQGDLRRVGVEMNIQLFDATVAWGRLATQEFDAFTMSFPYVSVLDAFNLYFRSTSTPTPNRMNWKNPQTDQWLDAGRAALSDADRQRYTTQLQRQIMEEAVWIPLIHDDLYVAAARSVQGVRPHGIYGTALYKGLDLRLQ